MKIVFVLLLIITSFSGFAQKSSPIDIPKGVAYKYCDSVTYEKAKVLVMQELTKQPTYELTGKVMFVGPVLWARFQKVKELKKIEGGNVTILIDGGKVGAKMTQSVVDSKKVWDALRKEIGAQEFKLRKATYEELQYYWAVISFDIEEPLIVVETKDHNYILNLSPKDMKIIWLDEAPKKK
ncbi:hypothetical protein [Cytophaga aurantiaca]|uniref:hypothetical protein n=1 Tax=Cytophaga aurantiaca TaxID=29530 RepID=UPI0012F7CF3F|nr:hypothetical protein [Cytophaga aurantiaca]